MSNAERIKNDFYNQLYSFLGMYLDETYQNLDTASGWKSLLYFNKH